MLEAEQGLGRVASPEATAALAEAVAQRMQARAAQQQAASAD